MATLIARHRSHRPGIGPHAARKLEIIQSLAERRAELSLEEGVAMESEEGEEEDLDDDGAPVRNPSSARFSPIASQSASFRAGTASGEFWWRNYCLCVSMQFLRSW